MNKMPTLHFENRYTSVS